MDGVNRNNKLGLFFAWGSSVAAVLNLCTFVFVAAAKTDQMALVIAAVSQCIITLIAIGAWEHYLVSLINR